MSNDTIKNVIIRNVIISNSCGKKRKDEVLKRIDFVILKVIIDKNSNTTAINC